MRLRKCDCCNLEIERGANLLIRVGFGLNPSDGHPEYVDLCLPCAENAGVWIKNHIDGSPRRIERIKELLINAVRAAQE